MIFLRGGGDQLNDTTTMVNPRDSKSKCKFGLMGYSQAKLPVWMSTNVYYYGARPSRKDTNILVEQEFNKKWKNGKNYLLVMYFH